MYNLTDKTLQNRFALQNIGPVSRLLRICLGFAAIFSITQILPVAGGGYALASLSIGIVLVISGVTGWCPLRATTHTKSCGIGGHAPCGTLPYQLEQLFRRRR